jgi:hypothetical protein
MSQGTEQSSRTTHTPGPWMLYVDHNTIDGAHGRRVCDTVERIEDARLISAAPELLAACKATLALLDHTAIGCDVQSATHGNVSDKLRAAIAKAEGTAPKELDDEADQT